MRMKAERACGNGEGGAPFREPRLLLLLLCWAGAYVFWWAWMWSAAFERVIPLGVLVFHPVWVSSWQRRRGFYRGWI
jgi:hypothetical protein